MERELATSDGVGKSSYRDESNVYFLVSTVYRMVYYHWWMHDFPFLFSMGTVVVWQMSEKGEKKNPPTADKWRPSPAHAVWLYDDDDDDELLWLADDLSDRLMTAIVQYRMTYLLFLGQKGRTDNNKKRVLEVGGVYL